MTTLEGTISRVIDNELLLVKIPDIRTPVTATLATVLGYKGEDLADAGIVTGCRVKLQLGPDNTVRALKRTGMVPVSAIAPVEHTNPGAIPLDAGGKHLTPDALPDGVVNAARALPLNVRAFGKLLNTATLQPGDLLLTKEISPDTISALITKVQLQGGYSEWHSGWTHAAMYLGDGLHLAEATFDNPLVGGSVQMSPIDNYCAGAHVLRIRRPKKLSEPQEGWRVCVRALSKLTRKYAIMEAMRLWVSVMLKGQTFANVSMEKSAYSALICSTLYADAFAEATRFLLGEVNNACVPAWLSGSDEFEDLDVRWQRIV